MVRTTYAELAPGTYAQRSASPFLGTTTVEQRPEPRLGRQLVAVPAGLEPQDLVAEQLPQHLPHLRRVPAPQQLAEA
jgi:hypothetical protein